MPLQITPRHLSLASVALMVAMLLAACSSGYGQSTAAPAGATSPAAASAGAAAGTSAVTIKGFAFNPGSLTIAAGTTVTWTNQDSASHTVTADDGTFDSKSLGTGGTFSQTFSKAGTYTYHCAIHTSMTGTVIVS